MSTQSPTGNNEIKTTRPLSVDEIACYHEDGFVIVPNFFSEEEISPLRQACYQDPDLCNKQVMFADGSGNMSYMVHWTKLDNTFIGVLPRLARMVDAAETLLGGIECYHQHSKIVQKKPHSPGRFEWHSSFGSSYQKTFLFPDEIGYFVAVTPTNRENGCLQVVRKSHKMGYVNHVLVGESYMCDPERMKLILEKLEVVYCEMQPGDAMFMHGNTLHFSEGNHTDSPRIVLAGHYATFDNEPVEGWEIYRYRPITKLPDTSIIEGNYESVFESHSFVDPEQSFKEILQSQQ